MIPMNIKPEIESGLGWHLAPVSEAAEQPVAHMLIPFIKALFRAITPLSERDGV